MRLVSLGLFASCVFLAACGGGDDGVSLVIDAEPPIPDSAPPPPDAEPCPDDECDGVCVDFDSDEAFCGDCSTSCEGGAVCMTGDCACPPAFVPATPTFLGTQLTDMIPMAVTGFGLYSGTGGFHALGAAYPVMEDGTTPAVEVDMAYTLTGALEAPGMLAGYNVDLQNQTADAAYAVTAGTITFTEICAGGFAGHANNVTFTGIMSFTNPTPDPSGCTFMVEVVNFAFGEACP